MPEGARVWLIPDGYLPKAGTGAPPGHDAICLLNTGASLAHVQIDLYFEDREPVLGIPIVVPARRTLHVRMDKPEMLAGHTVPRETPYAARIRSDVPISAQYSRLDVTRPDMTLMTTMAYPVEPGASTIAPRTRRQRHA